MKYEITKIYVCPCKDCTFETGRKVGCHSKCNKYLEWRDWLDKYNKFEREQKILDNIGYRRK